jgi:hypothetical protein
LESSDSAFHGSERDIGAYSRLSLGLFVVPPFSVKQDVSVDLDENVAEYLLYLFLILSLVSWVYPLSESNFLAFV